MSLRSILGGSGRVKKRSKTTSTLSSRPSTQRVSSSSSAPDLSSSSASPSSWAASLPRRKPGGVGGTKTTAARRNKSSAGKFVDDEYDFLAYDDDDEQLDDTGLVAILNTDLTLRDTPQAIQYARAHMFTPFPTTASGMTSTRVAEVLNYRRALPPIISVAHVQALLSSPSAVEREVAELAHAGILHRIIVPHRGPAGELIVLAEDYKAMLLNATNTAAAAGGGGESTMLSVNTQEKLLEFLAANPGSSSLGLGLGDATATTILTPSEIRSLVQAGFLTAHHTGGIITTHGSMSGTVRSYACPEDRITLTSLEMVSRQAAGTLGTVGGEGALYNVGGSGGGRSLSTVVGLTPAATEYRLAVPGAGPYLKLVSAAVEHLVALLGRSRFHEAPESLLRESWDGGVTVDEAARKRAMARRAHGGSGAGAEFGGVLPGQTRKWRQFYGLSFSCVFHEAVGAGLVEVFETGSVGRGIRALR